MLISPLQFEHPALRSADEIEGYVLTFRDTLAYQNFKGELVLDIYCFVLEGGDLLHLKTLGFFVAESFDKLQNTISKLYSNIAIDRLVRFSSNPDNGNYGSANRRCQCCCYCFG